MPAASRVDGRGVDRLAEDRASPARTLRDRLDAGRLRGGVAGAIGIGEKLFCAVIA